MYLYTNLYMSITSSVLIQFNLTTLVMTILYCLSWFGIKIITYISVCQVPENSGCICTLQASAVNFTIYVPTLPASTLTIQKLALFIFLKLAGLCEERSLSSQSCEAGKWLLLQVCILCSLRTDMYLNSMKQCTIKTIFLSINLTHYLRRKLKGLNI